ncbi:MAG: hypothetical protein M1379_11945 [Firmicutes bacterium]|nr:hypothetical protein [Bacillota bacterium]
MDIDALVAAIAEEVLRRLNATREAGGTAKKRVLVVFSGNKAGVDKVLGQIRQLQDPAAAGAVELAGYASWSAGHLIGPEKLSQTTGIGEILTDQTLRPPQEVVQKTDLFILANPSQNLLAKVALGIRDTCSTELLALALIAGKPVVAPGGLEELAGSLVDGSDVRADVPGGAGFTKMPAPYRKMLEEYLARLSSFGVRFVIPDQLAQAVSDWLKHPARPIAEQTTGAGYRNRNPDFRGEVPGLPGGARGRQVITREDILEAVKDGGREIILQGNAIVTPLARDLSRERGIHFKTPKEIEIGQKG